MENDRSAVKFTQIVEQITELNKLNQGIGLGGRMIKYNEEFGEFNAEVFKMLKDHTPKPFDRDHLVEEAADWLQCAISILTDEKFQEQGITVQEILEKILVKNIKWKNQAEKLNNK